MQLSMKKLYPGRLENMEGKKKTELYKLYILFHLGKHNCIENPQTSALQIVEKMPETFSKNIVKQGSQKQRH